MNVCISCKSKKILNILSFGKIPISNDFTKLANQKKMKKYKLGLNFCKSCFLVQNSMLINNKKIFNDNYLYHSSYSKSWLAHSKKLSDFCIKKFKLNSNSLVFEIASNDGYLLKYFKKKNIQTVGVEPSKSVAKVAKKKGIKTYVEFFSKNFVKKYKKKIVPNLIIALNVMAHTPKINSFVKALSQILNKHNVCIIEVPYVLNLIKKKQIDTIYHEHYSYFSITSISNILRKFNLELFDIKLIKTHGGSLRLFVKKKNNVKFIINKKIKKFIRAEKKIGFNDEKFYKNFSVEVEKILKINEKKIKALCKNNNVIGYGAAAKATIICNLLKLDKEHIRYIIDKNIYKQSRYIPGTQIKIISDNILKKFKPDYVLIFVWNIKREIISEITRNNKTLKFITFEPNFKIHKIK